MATRRYGVSVGEQKVIESVGAAVDSKVVEVTVELAATAVNKTGGKRQLTKNEVLQSLDKIKEHILTNKWPPA